MLLVPLEGSCATLTSEALSFFYGIRTLSASSLSNGLQLCISRVMFWTFFLSTSGNYISTSIVPAVKQARSIILIAVSRVFVAHQTLPWVGAVRATVFDNDSCKSIE